jgi:uncharacterized protein
MTGIRGFRGQTVLFTLTGIIAALWIGWSYSGTVEGALKTLFLATVLSILEVSLSIDNAIVNATILKRMTPVWQKRFLMWGIFIAVFGMRLIFPLLLVSVVANINPWQALILAASKPHEYARLMISAHVSLAAFGGSFLMMVAMEYFFRRSKKVFWIRFIEEPLSRLGRLHSAEIGITLMIIYFFSEIQTGPEKSTFLISGLWGTITFIIVDGISNFLHDTHEDKSLIDMHKISMSMFIYLEVLDASFSFDGVVGAFAITHNLFIIMIGLGVGAMYVRTLTIILVEKGTLLEFRYLENGAFYAIGILSLIMFSGTVIHIPEIFTGLIGIILIGMSLVSSILYNRREKTNLNG